MKTKLLFMLVLCSFYFVSCSNEVKTDVKGNVNVEASYVKLNESLDLYNQNFIATHPTSVQTRGRFWDWFKGVILSDATGALIGSSLGAGGALVGGLLFSASAASCSYVVPNPQIDTSVYFEANLNIKEDSIGFLHNTILCEIAEENEEAFTQNLTTEEWMDILTLKAQKYGYSVSENEKATIIGQKNNIPLSAELIQDEEQLAAYYEKKAPECVQQLKVLNSYVSMAAQITDQEDLKEYTQGCKKIICEAQLPVEEQKSLVASVAVAENSAILWAEAEKINSLNP